MNNDPYNVIALDDNEPNQMEDQVQKINNVLQNSGSDDNEKLNLQVIQKYRQSLETIIQNLLADEEYFQEIPQLFKKLEQTSKKKISWQAAFSHEFVQKLIFVQQQLYTLKIKINWKFLEQQIEFWKRQIMKGMFDCSLERKKFGKNGQSVD